MSVIDINTRTRHAGKGRLGASLVSGADGGMASGVDASSSGFAGMPISADLSFELQSLNHAVRESGGGAPKCRPEGGAVSHVSAMLQKMRVASAAEHDRKSGDGAARSDFKSWHDQIQTARQAMMENSESLDVGVAGSAGDKLDIVPVFPVETQDVVAARPLWGTPDVVPFATTVTVGHPMQKDIALGLLDACVDVGDVLGRTVKVNIQGVSFTAQISQNVVDAVGADVTLSRIIGGALQKAIHDYAMVANGDVIDAAFDGATLTVKYVGEAKKPILVSAFSELCPAADVRPTEVDIVGVEGPLVRVVASPIDGIFAEFSRSCISIRRRQFVNDNALVLATQDSAGDGAVEVRDFSTAATVSDKRSIIQQAAMAMIRKARQTPVQDQ